MLQLRKTNAETALYQNNFLSPFKYSSPNEWFIFHCSFQAPSIFELLTCRIFHNFWHSLSFFSAESNTLEYQKLQEAIRNGADIHPGATHYRDKNNTYKLQAVPAKRHSVAKMLPASRGSICQPGRDPNCEFESKVVYRHLQDGDIVLVNRQVCLYSHSSIFLISNIWFSPSSPIETPF